MKIEKVLMVISLAVIIPFIFISFGYGAVALSNSDALVLKAEQMGKVRVIVTFSVPKLAQLQATSHTFRSAIRTKAEIDAVRSDARAADNALASAINKAGSNIFSELGLSGKIKRIFKVVPQAVLEVTPEELLALAGHQGVTQVVEDKMVPLPTPDTVGDDDDDDDDDGDVTQLSYGVDIVNAPEAWDLGFDGSGWYVAVLDTGVRTSHEMFAGKDIVEACFSSNNSSYNSSSLCPNGSEEQEGPGSAVPPAESAYAHGTHVAGIAVGHQQTGELSGVAPGADLVSIQVFSYFSGSSVPVQSFHSDQMAGLQYVYDLRTSYAISSVNLSLGGDDTYGSYCDTDVRKELIDQLTAAGIAVAIASGNSASCNGISAPGCISSAVTVGGSNADDEKYSQSNWQSTIQDIFAPGEDIYSALCTGDSDYGMKSGTSMATPHVAGAWAVFRQAAPWATVTVSQLESIMEQTGTDIESGCGGNPSTGPRLDVAAVVEQYLDEDAAPKADAGRDRTVAGMVTVSLDGDASTSFTGHGLTYAWTQTSGTTVTLSDATTVYPSFTAPEAEIDSVQTLVFELTVTDKHNALTDTDSVTITVGENGPPTPDAGQEQTVNSGTTVFLDGSGSTSNTGGALTYTWTQTSGVTVTLSDPHVASPTFVGPLVQSSTTLEFELLVTDTSNDLTATDSVRVTVDHIDANLGVGFTPATAYEGEILGFQVMGDGALVYLLPLDPAQQDYESLGVKSMKYLFDTTIKCSPGATVKLAWQFPRKMPHSNVGTIYDAASGWSFSHPQWSFDRKMAARSLTDSDGDGLISLRSGIAELHSHESDDGLISGCFVDSAADRQKGQR